MSCCDPIGSDMPAVKDCSDCGQAVDEDGDTLEMCAYSPTECYTCGFTPCDQSC